MANPIEDQIKLPGYTTPESWVLQWQYPQFYGQYRFVKLVTAVLISADKTQLCLLESIYPQWVEGLKGYRHITGWWSRLKDRVRAEHTNAE